MTPDRWREIERLYHSARERGPAVLSGTDPELRREVERLLDQDASGKLLDRPAGELFRDLTWDEGEFPDEVDRAGETVAQFRIVGRLGSGGMGVVYKAFDTKLNRHVALKFLPPPLRRDPELKRRLIDEARAASALDHPHIVVVHEIAEAGDDLFIAMAFHEGDTLRARLDQPLPVVEALQIARQVASGLARAHDGGIFHGDIKPTNIMVAKDGVVRIIDFGLAKSVDVAGSTGEAPRGTPLYMSPEQASGQAIDFRTDIWSLGVVLYQMLAGVPPFRGDTVPELIRAVGDANPIPLDDVRPGLPAALSTIVTRALQKDPDQRYSSAREMEKDLLAALVAIESPARPRVPAVYLVALILLLAMTGTAVWLYKRSQRQLWARAEAIPQITQWKDQHKPLAAYLLLEQVESILPGDSQLAQLKQMLTHEATVRSSPSGAVVAIQDYLSPNGPWHTLGVTPLHRARIPTGYLRWRISKEGLPDFEGAPVTADMLGPIRTFDFPVEGSAHAPDGMVAVPPAEYANVVWSLGAIGPYNLPGYFIDRFEVTNREYQRFVDAGGYQKSEFWKQHFVKDGHQLSWSEAMKFFHDSTGRPGPATWTEGRYPPGQADYPVGGVSWFEAAAYAEFAGKSLPTLAQWFQAAPSSVAKHIIAMSNFSSSPAPVGRYQGLGPWGTYDMAGNVAEWCWNGAGGGARFQLGGAFGSASAEYFEPGTIPPWHRGASAGFRCVRNVTPLPQEVLADRRPILQDFSQAKPAGDDTFRTYRALYAYDHTPLNAKAESVKQDSPDWRREKVIIDASYGNERLPIHLFLPARARPPFQTVVYFPTARSLNAAAGDALADMHLIDYVVQSGRAVVYPIYKGTYDRVAAAVPGSDTVASRETLIQDSKDLGRTIDYLETRPDINSKRLAYMGTSMGAALGVILAGVEERLRTVIFLDGGFFIEKPLVGANQADFAPRIKVPALLISGKFDWIFYGKDALLRLIGTSPANKKAVTFDTAHDVSEQRSDLTREVLAWLDRYLGRPVAPEPGAR